MRKLLGCVALAAMLLVASSASAQRVRVNRFTPLGIRPDVAVRNGGAVAVNVNAFGGVHVNAFRARPTVIVNGFGQPLVVQSAPIVVAPVATTFVAPTAIYGGFGFQSFGGCGGVGVSAFGVRGACW